MYVYRGRDRRVVGFTTVYAINAYHHSTTNVVNSNFAHGEMYLIQHYAIKSATDLRQFGGFFSVFRFSWTIELTWNIVESGINHHYPNPKPNHMTIAWLIRIFPCRKLYVKKNPGKKVKTNLTTLKELHWFMLIYFIVILLFWKILYLCFSYRM